MKLSATALIVMFLFTSTAQAEESFHHSQIKLFATVGLDHQEDKELRAHFATAENLNNTRAFLGIEFKPAKWLAIEPTLGWFFGKSEPIASLSFVPVFGKFHGLMEVEFQLLSRDGYWSAQLDYQLFKWLYVGAEIDSVGNYEPDRHWSYSGGPNLLFRLDKFGLDLALHARETDHAIEPKFLMRIHFFL